MLVVKDADLNIGHALDTVDLCQNVCVGLCMYILLLADMIA